MKGIERRRACLVCVERDAALCIELEDPTTRKRFWSVPGGAVHHGESPEAAAVRETLEETGYRTSVIPGTERLSRYDFRWDGKVYVCTTHWFRGAIEDSVPDEVFDERYIVKAVWLPVKRLRTLLSSHPPIRDAVLAVACKQRHSSLATRSS